MSILKKKLFLCSLLVYALALGARAAESTLVSKENPLYAYEIEGLSVPLAGVKDYSEYKVNPALTIGDNFKNVTIIKRLFIDNSNQESLSFYLEQARSAHSLYPENVAIACFYSYALFYSDHTRLTESLAILIPYIQEIDLNPGIPRTIWAFLNFYVMNEALLKDASSTFFNLPELFETDDPKLILSQLELLSNYWATKIDPIYSTRWSDERIKVAQNKLSANGGEDEALAMWRKLVYNIYKQFINETELLKKRKEQDIIHDAISLQARNELKDTFTQAVSMLNAFNTAPNSLEKIELTLNKITQYRRQLKQYPDIPNYEDLKKSVGEYETQVINIAYKAYILREFKECLSLIDGLDKKLCSKDSRVFAIKIYCMQKEKFQALQIIGAIEQLLALEPNNQRAFMLKKMLEAQEEFRQKSQ